MIPFKSAPQKTLVHEGVSIACFETGGPNLDDEIVGSFGSEWRRFAWFSEEAIETTGAEYFDIVPGDVLAKVANALDVGCGSGRWSRYLSSRVGFVEAVDPSEAVLSAAHLNRDRENVRVTRASIDDIPFADASFDLVVCLGVIHHLPDPALALKKLVAKLRPGGHALIYVYYKVDHRGPLFRGLFHLADALRRVVSRLPQGLKLAVCDVLAFVIYLPLVFLARVIAFLVGAAGAAGLPLTYYRNKTLREIRTDALDRFGTAVEKRYSRQEFASMMASSGLDDVVISTTAPFWHGLGRKA